MAKIIALSGWKQSGKDSLADFICEEGGGMFKRYGFANVLKDMVATQYNIPRESCDLTELKEQPLKQYPANPQDAFSEMVCLYMAKELKPLTDLPDANLHWTPRALCILEGSVKRSVNSSYWVQRVIDQIKLDLYSASDYNFVITDMRYKSEMEQLKNAFGSDLVTVRINRFDNSPSTDPSERDLDDGEFDYVIENRAGISDFHHKINDLLASIDIRSEKIDY